MADAPRPPLCRNYAFNPRKSTSTRLFSRSSSSIVRRPCRAAASAPGCTSGSRRPPGDRRILEPPRDQLLVERGDVPLRSGRIEVDHVRHEGRLATEVKLRLAKVVDDSVAGLTGRDFEAAVGELRALLLRPSRADEPDRPSPAIGWIRQRIESIIQTLKGQLLLNATAVVSQVCSPASVRASSLSAHASRSTNGSGSQAES